MTLQQLTYFEAIARTQNLSRAAEELFIAQPSLSISMRKLEEELTVPLFSRKGHRTVLTEEGELFLEHVSRIRRELSEAQEHMKRIGTMKKHTVSVGCTTPVLCDLLPKTMQAFRSAPGRERTRFIVSSGNTPELIRKLKAGVFDCLICSQYPDPDILQLPLEEDPILLIVPAGTAAPASWEEVLQHPLIGYEEGSAMTEVLLSISREIGYPFTFDFLAPNEEAVASLVSHGMGYAIAPYNRTMRGHEIAVLPLPTGTYTRKNCLTVKRGSVPHGQAAGDYIDFLNDFAAQTALGG